MKPFTKPDVQVITARLRQVEEEIHKLRNLVADLPFYKHILHELLRKQR
jgi:hypothetical protein